MDHLDSHRDGCGFHSGGCGIPAGTAQPGQVDTSHREGGTRGGDHSSSSSEGDQQRHSGNDGHYGIGGGDHHSAGGGDTQHGDQHGTYRPGGTSGTPGGTATLGDGDSNSAAHLRAPALIDSHQAPRHTSGGTRASSGDGPQTPQ